MIKKGMLMVISGPSGAGKGTLFKRLLSEDSSFRFSVSYTTRKPRPTEIEGVDYKYVSEEEFGEMVRSGGFLEYASVHGHHYGTPRREVEGYINAGENVLLDIDPQGARNVMAAMPDCVTVFILPPSYKELRRRLHTRNTEDPAEIERRLGNARGEIEQMHLYQYVLVNDTVEQAYEELKNIAEAEKHRSTRYFPEIPEE